MSDLYTMHYGNFVGVDASGDAREVSRNRLAYSVNMWRDYESEQGAAVETFPGFRRVATSLGFDADGGDKGAVHGLYHFRTRRGVDLVVVHAGARIYAFEAEKLARGEYLDELMRDAILSEGVADRDSTAFIFNNNLYILDGEHYLRVSDVGEESASIAASAVDAYVPTTYFNGNMYEQRNMLSERAYQVETTTERSKNGWVELNYPSNEDNSSDRCCYRTVNVIEYAQAVKRVWFGEKECLYRNSYWEPEMIDGDLLRVATYLGSDGHNFYWNTLATGDVIYNVEYKDVEMEGETKRIVSKVYIFSADDKVTEEDLEVKVELELYPAHIQTAEHLNNFKDSNPDYKKTTMEALNGCTKAAVFDGRVFLTGNGELPNTVFYSHRNLTGANDPAYFGIYNYFNDGVGNTPNVDLLATPSFLMVIKGDTVQDGSVYYHTGMDNTDEFSADLLPRIYPSTQGAAGIGSAGKAVPSRLSCNFLDDPVFLSKRGLEGVSKETVNLERTIGHRSSNVDRLLLKEDLSRASIAEWKGYLVICCNGRMYLADSRYLTRHEDGSYQYEWYYLEGVGTYDTYAPRWGYWLDAYPLIEREGVSAETLDNFLTKDGERVGDRYFLRESGDVDDIYSIMAMPVYHPDNDAVVLDLYYVEADGKRYVVALNGDEKVGVGSFHGASKILAVGERLLFGTGNGDLCIVNTDMRGVTVGDRQVESDRIDRSFYSFAGVAYKSGCAMRLDDCGKKSVTKYTECGTTAVRFKAMPGSRAKVNVSLNGRDWHPLGEVFNSRFDFSDIQFSNFSFGENENNVAILPELTRGWVQKQYYVYNDRFEEPFGLYELSYMYYVYGKIRY